MSLLSVRPRRIFRWHDGSPSSHVRPVESRATTIHHSETRLRFKCSKLIYSSCRDSCHVSPRSERSGEAGADD